MANDFTGNNLQAASGKGGTAAAGAAPPPNTAGDDVAALPELLGQLAQSVGTAQNLEAVFRALRDFAVIATPSNGLFASLYDPTVPQRVCVYAWSEGQEIDPATLPPMPMSNSPHSRAVATGEVVVTDDLQAKLNGQPRVDLAMDVDPRLPRSSLAVPMAVMGRVIGGFEVQSAHRAAYREHHIMALRLAANLAAIATENVQLIERERGLRLAAEASEQRLRGLVSNAADLILVVDTTGHVRYCSPSVTRLFHYEPDELLGKRVSAFLHPADRGVARAAVEAAQGSSLPLPPVELRVRNRAGEWCDVEAVLTGLLHDPSVGGIVVNARDITTRKRGEAGMRLLAEASRVFASSLDYATTLNNVAELAVHTVADWCIVDMLEADGSIRRVAVAAADPAKLGLLDELQEHYPPDWSSPQPAAMALRAGTAQLLPSFTTESLAATCRDEEHFRLLQALDPRSAMAVPLIARGQTIGVLTLATAESNRRYTPVDLDLARELGHRAALAIDNARLYHAAQSAIEVRDTFLSIASHELKTPLTPLLMYAQALQRRSARDPAASLRDQRAVQVIAEQANRLNRLIEALLDLSRIQGGRLAIERQPVDLAVLARRVVEELQAVVSAHVLTLDAPDQLVVSGDELRLEQVLQNLLGNALKYSPHGGTIRVTLARDGDHAHVAVSDQGIGIPAAAQPYLFERFFRAPNVEPSHTSGFGIGLYVVHEIVQLHGGTIAVTSVEGQGSTFTVTLPLATEHHTAPFP